MSACLLCAQGPYQATGIRICEVDLSSAIVWTRLTRVAERISAGHPMPVVRYRDDKTGQLASRRKGRPNLTLAEDILAGTVERGGGKPVLTFRHYSVDGKVLNEDRREAR